MQVPQAISLHELNAQIKNALRDKFVMPVWIIAEINQLNAHRSGHCYLELIEKETDQDSIIANIRATIWASSFNKISAFFKSSTGQELKSGIKVMLKVQVDFHELYGISLNVRDIDPNYTLGDQARQRAEIIKKLEEAGVLSMNKELELVRVPQKIAIISSSSAAGYEDFCMQLNSNAGNYQFYWKLFPASMQGDKTPQSIIQALDYISEFDDFFEAVVIIRGGGSKTDLSYFDDFELAYYITQFPLPIITGIGHERDDSVIDEVAHTRCKTPTAVAEFLIDQAEQFETELDWLKDQITRQSKDQLNDNKNHLIQLINSIRSGTQSYTEDQKSSLREKAIYANSHSQAFIKKLSEPIHRIEGNISKISGYYLKTRVSQLDQMTREISNISQNKVTTEKHQLDIFSREVEFLNPLNILKKGYSISYFKGKVLKNPIDIKKGDQITTRLNEGDITSTVE